MICKDLKKLSAGEKALCGRARPQLGCRGLADYSNNSNMLKSANTIRIYKGWNPDSKFFLNSLVSLILSMIAID